MLRSTFKYDGYTRMFCLDHWHRGYLISRDYKHWKAPRHWSFGCLASFHFPPLPASTEPIPVRFDRLAGDLVRQSSDTLHESWWLGRGERTAWGTDKAGAG